MNSNLRVWRARLRLSSGLVMLAFVICHLTAHWFLLVSVENGETVLTFLMSPWRTWLGTSILIAAFGVHYSNALWSIYIRRSLRLSRWELTQVALGLCIPFLLMFHVIGTRIAESTLDVTIYYNTVFIAQWLHRPWLGAMQMIALITVWIHACIGIHYWLRTSAGTQRGGRHFSSMGCCCRRWRWLAMSAAAIRSSARQTPILISYARQPRTPISPRKPPRLSTGWRLSVSA